MKIEKTGDETVISVEPRGSWLNLLQAFLGLFIFLMSYVNYNGSIRYDSSIWLTLIKIILFLAAVYLIVNEILKFRGKTKAIPFIVLNDKGFSINRKKYDWSSVEDIFPPVIDNDFSTVFVYRNKNKIVAAASNAKEQRLIDDTLMSYYLKYKEEQDENS